MNDNDVVVMFCNAHIAEELGVRKDVVVITELLPDDTVVIVKRDEFIEWLMEKYDETD